MKNKLLILATLLTISINYAQTDDYTEMSRTILKSETKEAIAEVMTLNETQSAPFWELYNEFELENYTVKNKRIAIINDYAKNFENTSNEKADELIKAFFAYKAEDLKLKKKYYKKMKKIIPATEAAKFIQAINKIDDLVNAELALEVPLIETE
ncbi:hypothetical protein Q4566_08810 [Tamlana sp. 2_MG-2023]|uniref:hypothetical protein n=1 Tax=unclassified Tamlana TaxID=2614803 RepID=UPI0026E44004|nr:MULTISPECIES: hypothetical protein [unclassified Tamlana]MDO6760295.1 hypothetical protein [Tamlana sp. 2_MG-2023]MDO6790007.1 hypothetical protein [Tamlana sp. 1_MG-2023]